MSAINFRRRMHVFSLFRLLTWNGIGRSSYSAIRCHNVYAKENTEVPLQKYLLYFSCTTTALIEIASYEMFNLSLFSSVILPQAAIASWQIEKFLITLPLCAIHRYEFIPRSLYRRQQCRSVAKPHDALLTSIKSTLASSMQTGCYLLALSSVKRAKQYLIWN